MRSRGLPADRDDGYGTNREPAVYEQPKQQQCSAANIRQPITSWSTITEFNIYIRVSVEHAAEQQRERRNALKLQHVVKLQPKCTVRFK